MYVDNFFPGMRQSETIFSKPNRLSVVEASSYKNAGRCTEREERAAARAVKASSYIYCEGRRAREGGEGCLCCCKQKPGILINILPFTDSE